MKIITLVSIVLLGFCMTLAGLIKQRRAEKAFDVQKNLATFSNAFGPKKEHY